MCSFKLRERVPQAPGALSNAGDAKAQGNHGRIFFGYFLLAAQTKVASPGSATRRFKKMEFWIPVSTGMTDSGPATRKPQSPITIATSNKNEITSPLVIKSISVSIFSSC